MPNAYTLQEYYVICIIIAVSKPNDVNELGENAGSDTTGDNECEIHQQEIDGEKQISIPQKGN